jgi:hypothetical protein
MGTVTHVDVHLIAIIRIDNKNVFNLAGTCKHFAEFGYYYLKFKRHFTDLTFNNGIIYIQHQNEIERNVWWTPTPSSTSDN